MYNGSQYQLLTVDRAIEAVQEITTTTDNGLKITTSGSTTNIDIDDDIVFILDGGTAADVI